MQASSLILVLSTARGLDEGDAANVGTDTFTGVREVRGSQFGDTLVGGDGSESFRGIGGDDFIDGGAGDRDRADYRNSPDSVFVDLSTGIAQDGFGGTDILVNIERAFEDRTRVTTRLLATRVITSLMVERVMTR